VIIFNKTSNFKVTITGMYLQIPWELVVGDPRNTLWEPLP